MGELPEEMNINRKFERDMFHMNNQIHDMKTGQIQDNTQKTLIGTIKDDFENKKEIFIAPEEEEGI